MSSKPMIAGISLVILISLGAADALITGTLPPRSAQEVPTEPGEPEPTPTPSPGGVTKREGPDIPTLLAEQDFTAQPTNETSLLRAVIPEDEATVESMVLLQDGDRAGFLAWTESTNVKTHFLALKEALHATFSPEVTDLVDETQQRSGKPTRNFLTFLDPSLSEERIVFVRVRQRLYEMHISEKKQEEMFGLMEGLTD